MDTSPQPSPQGEGERYKMRKEIITKILLTLIVAGFSLEAYADTSANLVFKTSVPKASKIVKLSAGSPVTANPENGTITGTLSSVFELDSNDTENASEFVITSTVETSSGAVAAYDSEGNIAFTNSDALPTCSAVSNALSHSGDNPNVIVYPVTITTSPFTSTFRAGYKTYGNCYVINLNGETEGTVTHSINSTPVTGTFHRTKDTTGVYRATITISSVEL